MTIRPIVLGTLLTLAALPLDAQRTTRSERRRERPADWGGGRQRLDTTIAFGKNGSLDLHGFSGDIRVTTWNRSEAKIVARVEQGELRVELSESRIRLEASHPGGDNDGEESFEITVPVGTRVDARTMSGDVSVKGTKGTVECESVSGNVTVDDARDRIELTSVSGDVFGTRLAGTIRANSVSGSVTLRDVSGDVNGETVSGDVMLDNVTSSDVRGQTVSGEVMYRGTMNADGRYEFKSHSGDVQLTVPGEAKATVTMRTYSGEVESDFPMTLAASGTGRRRGDRMDFTINGGGARVSLESFSGTISVRRAGARTNKED